MKKRGFMTVDLNDGMKVYDYATKTTVSVSASRRIAHEMSHAVLGVSDFRHQSVKFTDSIMKSINGTQRKSHSNWCTSSIGCFFNGVTR